MQVIAQSSPIYTIMKNTYYFATMADNLNAISDISTDCEVRLSWLIGESLSFLIRDKRQPLELLRLRGHDCEIIARRRFNDIIVNIHQYAHNE